MKGGSCYSEAAGGGSRGRLIRKYKTTSTVAPATLTAHESNANKKSQLFSFAEFWICSFEIKQDSMSDCVPWKCYSTVS